MHFGQLLQPQFFVPSMIALAALTWGYRRGWFDRCLSQPEFAALGKLIFIIAAVMLMIAVNNSIDLPAGQFIYGRF